MSKRPMIDLMALTSEQAAPMHEAVQRVATRPAEASDPASPKAYPSQNLEGLTFKVSPQFRRRFRERAASADMKLNELLFEALDAWEQSRGLKS